MIFSLIDAKEDISPSLSYGRLSSILRKQHRLCDLGPPSLMMRGTMRKRSCIET